MSPRLEKALSEAIEEELTRELAPILGPIMSRIKKLIPSIIESCRLKLRCTSPSSDEETIFTPPAVSSGGGSSDNETKSSDKQTEYRGCAVVSRCSGSSFEIVPIPEDHSSKAQGKQSRPVASSKNDMSIAGQQVDSPPMSGTDFGVFNSDTLREIPNNCGINIEDYLNIGYESDLFALPGEFPIDSALPATEGSVHCPMSTADMAFETFDFIDNSPQKINACLPESQLPAWSFPGSGWDGGPQRVLGSEQQGGPVPREQEPHPGENPL
jgi:hypothetical protein